MTILFCAVYVAGIMALGGIGAICAIRAKLHKPKTAWLISGIFVAVTIALSYRAVFSGVNAFFR